MIFRLTLILKNLKGKEYFRTGKGETLTQAYQSLITTQSGITNNRELKKQIEMEIEAVASFIKNAKLTAKYQRPARRYRMTELIDTSNGKLIGFKRNGKNLPLTPENLKIWNEQED